VSLVQNLRTSSHFIRNYRWLTGFRQRGGWIAGPSSYYQSEVRERALGITKYLQPEEMIVKSLSLIVSLLLASSGTALAQQSTGIRGSAAGNAKTTATADKEGANVNSSAAGAASATTDHSSANIGYGTELNATLTKPVDARNAKPGDEVTATMSEDIKSDGQVLIKKGSKLMGHVTTARPLSGEKKSAEGGAGSQLGIVFDRAVLKDGSSVPINATVHALAAAESSASMGMSDANAGIAGAGAAGSSGGGLVGGVAGGASGAIGGVAGRTGAIASGTAAGSSAALSRSAGAVGGLNAAGRLTSGSKGTFGLRGIDVSSATSADAKGSILSSSTQNVRLDRGTRMLLVNGGAAGASTIATSKATSSASATAAGTASPAE
jgi:hypothetical protein